MRHPKYGELRNHQFEITTLVPKILARLVGNVTFCDITPGGGKTLLGALDADLMIDAGLVDAVVWVVPTNALLDQVQDGFHVPTRNLFRRLAIWGRKGQHVGQRTTSGHDCVGYVITYSTPPKTIRQILRALRGKRILLILDEFHHIGVRVGADDDPDETGLPTAAVRKSWKATADLLRYGFDVVRKGRPDEHVDGAAYVLLMSGTAWRHDGLDLPYLESHRDATGSLRPDIECSRENALEERAVLPMVFDLTQGEVSYRVKDETKTVLIEDATGTIRTKALRAFLDADATWATILDRCVAHWRDYRESHYRSRLLVLARDRKDARRAAAYLKEVRKVGEVTLAIGDEPDAHKKIQAFRNGGHSDVLVTVRMAYEGFDVPNITHVACVTNVRSVQFLDQCFNRATRVNHTCGLPWEEQAAYIFAPCDVAMQKYVDSIHAAQRRLVEAGHAESERSVSATRATAARAPFEALKGLPGLSRAGGEKGLLTPAENERVRKAKEAVPRWKDWDPHQILAALAALGEVAA